MGGNRVNFDGWEMDGWDYMGICTIRGTIGDGRICGEIFIEYNNMRMTVRVFQHFPVYRGAIPISWK